MKRCRVEDWGGVGGRVMMIMVKWRMVGVKRRRVKRRIGVVVSARVDGIHRIGTSSAILCSDLLWMWYYSCLMGANERSDCYYLSLLFVDMDNYC